MNQSSKVYLSPAWNEPGRPLRRSWSGLVNVDQFRWLPRADVLRHLGLARDELGAAHVRAAAMYSPEMRVRGARLADWRLPAAERACHPNWQLVDLSIEALLDIGLKPVYTTCFTPQGMTDQPETCWPDRNPVGMPRSLAQWEEFVAHGLRHHLRRFGREELRSWYFECWNEPNLRDSFFAGGREDFFRLWAATRRAVKSVDPEFRFGGPSTARGEWLPEFLDWTAEEGCPPDYLISHVYNNDSAAQPLSPFDGPASHRVADSPHFAAGVIRGVRQMLDERGFTGEVHWNEWGRSWFPSDPLRETALEAAFIAKTMAETSDLADFFAYWCLSDIYDQVGFQASEFEGHYGMLSLHGLRKPAWQAHALMQRLGPSRLPVEGTTGTIQAIATTGPDGPAIMIASYPGSPAAEGPAQVHLSWPTPRASLIRLADSENNLIHDWQEMGAPASPDREQLARLRSVDPLQPASPGSLTLSPASGGGYEAVFTLPTPGTAFLSLHDC